MKKLTVSEDGLAKHWGVTARWVRSMAEEDVAVRVGKQYDLIESDRRLIAFLRRDEHGKRIKREMLRAQIQRKELEMQKIDGEFLRPAEVQKYIGKAWDALLRGHRAALNHVYIDLRYQRPINDAQALTAILKLEDRVRGEMMLARDSLERLHKSALDEMQSDARNGIIQCDREIRRLKDALGEE